MERTSKILSHLEQRSCIITQDFVAKCVREQRKQVAKVNGLKADEEEAEGQEASALSLSFRNIQSIGKNSFLPYSMLVELSLGNNQIEKIEGLHALPNLVKLDLSFNKIQELNGLETLAKLKDLNLSFNLVTELSNMENLAALRSLSIAYNRLRDPEQTVSYLQQFTKLKALSLQGNPFNEAKPYLEESSGLKLPDPAAKPPSDEAYKDLCHALLNLTYLDYNLSMQHEIERARTTVSEHLMEEATLRRETERRNTMLMAEKKKMDVADIPGLRELCKELRDSISLSSERAVALAVQFGNQIREIAEDFVTNAIERSQTKRYSLLVYRQDSERLLDEAEKNADLAVTTFEKAFPHTKREHDGSQTEIGEFESSKRALNDELISFELDAKKRIAQSYELLADTLEKALERHISQMSAFFRQITELQTDFLQQIRELDEPDINEEEIQQVSSSNQKKTDELHTKLKQLAMNRHKKCLRDIRDAERRRSRVRLNSIVQLLQQKRFD